MRKPLISMLLIASAVSVLAGCASGQWAKEGATASDFNADRSACEYEAMKYAGGYDNSYQTAFASGLDMALRRNEITKACLQQKGYRLVPG